MLFHPFMTQPRHFKRNKVTNGFSKVFPGFSKVFHGVSKVFQGIYQTFQGKLEATKLGGFSRNIVSYKIPELCYFCVQFKI